jgi:hypothetical protein
MKLERFQAILDAYGASSERWPEKERADALALSRTSVVAARALAQARTLDAALDAFEYAEVTPEPARLAALRSRIVAAALPRAKNWLSDWFGLDLSPAQLWPSLAGFGLMTVLGFAVGFGGLIESSSARDGDDAITISALDIVSDGSGQ